MLGPLAIGAAMGGLFIVLARRVRPGGAAELPLSAAALILAALIYVGFALRAGSPGPAWLVLEVAGLALFSLLAWFGLRGSAWWLALGWGIHACVWDFLLHLHQPSQFVPAWYPFWCGGLDLAVAALLAASVARAGKLRPDPR